MAKCPGCGSELSAGARFCSLCGRVAAPSPAAHPAEPAATRPSPEAAEPSSLDAGQRKVIYASLGAAALILLGVVLFAQVRSGVLSAQGTRTPATGVLNAPSAQTPQSPVLTAPAPNSPTAPVIQAPQTASVPMPEDVIEYLRWLKRFEAGRRDLEKQGFSALIVFAHPLKSPLVTGLLKEDQAEETTQPNPAQDRDISIGNVILEWNRAAALFQQKTPPDPCATLATHYNQALVLGVQRMSIIQQMLPKQSMDGSKGEQDASARINELLKILDGAQDVDVAQSEADNALNALRARYTSMPEDVRTFDIKPVQTGFDPRSMLKGLGL